MNINHAQILGNLTRDPELRQTKSGQDVCSFSVATNREWKNKDGEKQKEVEYHNMVAWGKTGELVAQYMKKGSQILVEGRLQTTTWEDKDGTKRYKTEIVAESIQFGNKPRNDRPEYDRGVGPGYMPQERPEVEPQPAPVDTGGNINVADIPF